jgi:chemotaxis protein CheC
MSEHANLDHNEIQNLIKVINQYIASQTSSALSKLLSEAVKYNVMILEQKYFSFRNIKLAPDEIQMCAVRLNGKGDTHIEICYAIKIQHAKMIASKLLCEEESNEISELGTSAIQEVANILTGSFFNAMSSATGFRVELSTPNYHQGDLATLANGNASDILKFNDVTVVADAELVGQESGIRIHMLIIQHANNARKLLKQIKKYKNSEFSALDNTKLKLQDIDAKESDNSQETTGNSELDSILEEFQKEGKNEQ